MVSESTWLRSGGHWVGRELACLRVVGRQKPVNVYEVAGLPGEPRPGSWPDFAAARTLFAQGRLSEAQALFERWPGDAAARAYAEKCRSLTTSSAAPWTGVWELSEK